MKEKRIGNLLLHFLLSYFTTALSYLRGEYPYLFHSWILRGFSRVLIPSYSLVSFFMICLMIAWKCIRIHGGRLLRPQRATEDLESEKYSA